VPAKLGRVLPHAVMLAVSIALYWCATRIDADTGGRIGPDVWPKAIIVFMGLLCVYEIAKRLVVKTEFEAKGLLSGTELPPTEPHSTGAPESQAEGPTHPMLYAGIALIGAYVVFVPWIGFFVATLAFLAIFPWIGGMRRPVLISLTALAGTLVLVVVFLKVAYISLPLGEGPFRWISLALMRALGVS
jgi:putative tricarboxylic transport membrane protein